MGSILVVGGGPAGMSAALAAVKGRAGRVILIERDHKLGGVLPQCIHDGFGLHTLKENLTGPEYAGYFIEKLNSSSVEVYTGTTVLSVTPKDNQYLVWVTGREIGVSNFLVDSIIFATGCYERPRGALGISGTRPAGIYTAGAVQYMMNRQNLKVGSKAVILGFGDIGLIMARRLTLEGIQVVGVYGKEITGLQRNMVQCIHEYNIPYMDQTVITQIFGHQRITGVEVTHLATGQAERVECDTLVLAVGLIGESSLAEQAGVQLAPNGSISVDNQSATNFSGVFACGNVVQVHDLVDHVTQAGEQAGWSAINYLERKRRETETEPDYQYPDFSVNVKKYNKERQGGIFCTLCPTGCLIFPKDDGFIGYGCLKGIAFAKQELVQPTRIVTTTVKWNDERFLLPVRTDIAIPREYIATVMNLCNTLLIEGNVDLRQVLIRDIAGTGVNLIATESRTI